MSVWYYWYDHCVLRETGEAELVQKAIEAHDFNAFCAIRNKYPDTEDCCYFPKYAWNENKKVNIMTPDGFAKITNSEYECG